jgi:hypothetical protein
VTSWVLFLLGNTSLYDLPSIVVCEQPPWIFMVMFMPLYALSYPC